MLASIGVIQSARINRLNLAGYFDYSWNMTNNDKLYQDAAGTILANDGLGVKLIKPDDGATNLPFTGLDTHTPIAGARASLPPYYNAFYRGVHMSNNNQQYYFINNLISPATDTFTIMVIERIMPAPPREGWLTGTNALGVELANAGSGFDRLEIGIGGGEITELAAGVGYPDGAGNNGDQFQLMINFYTKSGTSWNHYRYTSTTRDTLGSWTTTANDTLSNLGIGSNGHQQTKMVHYVGVMDSAVMTLANMNAIASTVNTTFDTLGSIKPNMPEANLTDIFYDRDLQRVKLTIEILNSTVAHDLEVQFFVINGGGVDLDNTALMTGANASLVLSGGADYDDSGDANVTITGSVIEWWIPKEGLTELLSKSPTVSANSTTDVFTVDTTDASWSAWADNDDVILVPVSGNTADYPTGLSRQKLYIINASGNGQTVGNTFQLTTVQGNAGNIVNMSDNGGDLYVIRKASLAGATMYYMAGVQCRRLSDGRKSIESMIDQSSWENDNID